MIFFIWLSRLVTSLYYIVQKSWRRWKIFYTTLYGVTKPLSQIKKIINFHHQFFKCYPTPSTINVKNHFHISDLDSYPRQVHTALYSHTLIWDKICPPIIILYSKTNYCAKCKAVNVFAKGIKYLFFLNIVLCHYSP